MVVNRVGPPVRGEDLFGRDAFVEVLWRKLYNGNVLLAAPRRFGKTSVMYRLIDQPREGFRIVHADLEHLSEPVDLILEMIVKMNADTTLSRLLTGFGAVSKGIWKNLRNAVDEVEAFDVKLKLREQIAPSWQETGRQLFRKLEESGQPVLFILDEFPMMIDRMARLNGKPDDARALLRWLRALRVSPTQNRTRFLIAGSIGAAAVLNQLGEITSINDFESLRLEPFSTKVANDFLAELASSERIDLSEANRLKMIDLVGVGVPYFLQILYSEVSKGHVLDRLSIVPEMIEKTYRDKVLGVDCKTYFDHYYGRLRDYYLPIEERAVKRLLKNLARTGPMSRDACYAVYRPAVGESADVETFNMTMSNLENDFYVRYDPDVERYTFACKLLRDWWLRHYGMEAI
ncbi:MAG: hypothetical protein ACLQVD_02600 [Capsulimonadaceae bacterium]